MSFSTTELLASLALQPSEEIELYEHDGCPYAKTVNWAENTIELEALQLEK